MAKRKVVDESEKPAAFEDSLTELQSIVSELESGSLGLETSLARFERGVGLLRTCYSILETAEQKVEILTRFNRENPPDIVPLENAASIDLVKGREGYADSVEDGDEIRPDANPETPSLF